MCECDYVQLHVFACYQILKWFCWMAVAVLWEIVEERWERPNCCRARAQVSLRDLQNSILTSIGLQDLTGFQTQSQYVSTTLIFWVGFSCDILSILACWHFTLLSFHHILLEMLSRLVPDVLLCACRFPPWVSGSKHWAAASNSSCRGGSGDVKERTVANWNMCRSDSLLLENC